MQARPAVRRHTLTPASRLVLVTASLVAVGLVVALLPGVANAAVDRNQAKRKALTALGARAGTAAVRVFALRTTVGPGTRITESGAASDRTAGVRWRDPATGVELVPAAPVMRTPGEPVWLFYADRGPHQAYEHQGAIALVGARTGRVFLSRRLRWLPLLDGRLPAFFATNSGYEGKRYQVFNRPWPLSAVTSRLRSGAAAQPAKLTPQQLAAGASVSERKTAAALAAERSCGLRISDTLGDFYDFGRVDWTRAGLGFFFKRLAAINPGFVTERYTLAGRRTPAAAAQRMIDRAGCRDLLIYAAGGAPRDGEPSVVIGIRSRADGTLVRHRLTLGQLRRLLRANGAVTFKLVFDAPYAGRLARGLRGEPNVALILTSGGPSEPSFSYLPAVTGRNGIIRNTGNPEHLLEFTNRLLLGLHRFTGTPAEVDAALARAPQSFMAWMLARAADLGPSPFGDDIGNPIIDGPDNRPVGTPGNANVAPVLGGTGGSLAYVEGQGGVPIAPGLTVSDNDSSKLNGAVVTVSAAYRNGEDVLGFTAQNGITGSFDPALGRLTLTGKATAAQYQTALRAVTYRNADDAPDPTQRTISFQADDGGSANHQSNLVTRAVDVTPTNDAPQLTPVTAGAYTENAAPAAVDGDLTITDPDSPQIQAATLAITGGFDDVDDELLFTDQNGIAGTYAPGTGVLTLTGDASPADYQTALRSVTFRTAGNDPGTSRTVTARATDAEAGDSAESDAVALPIVVSPVNDAPDITGPASASTNEDTAKVFSAANANALSISDPDVRGDDMRLDLQVGHGRLTLGSTSGLTFTAGDGTNDPDMAFTGTRAAINDAIDGLSYAPTADYDGSDTIQANVHDLGHNGGGGALSDTLNVAISTNPVNDAPVNTVPGAQSLDEDATHAMNGVFSIADVDAHSGDALETSLSAPDGVITVAAGAALTGNGSSLVKIEGTLAQINTSLASVSYTAPLDVNGSRTLTMLTADLGHNPAPSQNDTDTVAMTIDAVNDAPVVTASTGTAAYAEDDATGVVVDPAVTVDDVDDTHLEGATIQITTNRDASDDELTFSAQNGITQASWTAATGTLVLTGHAVEADYQAALRSIRFKADGDDPGDATRTVAFEVTDGDDDSATDSRDVTVTPSNDKPVVLTSGGVTDFQESATPSAVAVDDGVVISDPDNASLDRVTLTIGDGHQPTDVLAYATAHGIEGSYDSPTGVMTLEAAGAATVAPVADFQAAAREVTFETPSSAPGGSREVTFRARDTGSAESDAATAHKDISINNVNEAPVISDLSGTVAYAENDPAVTLDGDAGVSDADGQDLSGGGTVTITSETFRAGDELGFTNQGGVHGSYDTSTGVLSITGTGSADEYRDFVRSVTFRTVDDTPDTGDRLIEFRVDDGQPVDHASNSASKLVTVTAANDAPTADDQSISPTEDSPQAFTVTGSDPENDSLTFHTFSDPPHGTITGSGASRTYTPDPDYSGADSFTFVADDGSLTDTGTVTVTVNPANDAPAITVTAGDAGFTEDGGPVAVDGGLTLTDAENHTISGATAEITGNFQSGEDTLVYPAPLHGIAGVVSGGGSKITFSTSGSTAEYQDVLRSVAFDNSSENPGSAIRTVDFTATDGGSPSASGTNSRQVTVGATNDAPVNSVPGAQTVDEDQTLTLTGADKLSISDTDAGSDDVEVTLTATNGVLTLGGTTGLDVTAGDGTGDATTTFIGTIADVNTALDGLQYQPTSNFSGSGDIQIATDDQGSTGGAAQQDTDSVAVTVSPVNDAPVMTAPASGSVDEDTDLTFSGNVSVADEDAGADDVRLTLGASHGTVTLSAMAGLTVVSGANGSASVVVEGTISDLNSALDGLEYRGDLNYNGSDTLLASIDDRGHTGGGALTDSASVAITVNPVNDNPVADDETFNGAQGAIGNTTHVVDDPDDGAPAVTHPKKSISGDILAGDSDVDGPGPLTVVPGTFATNDGGTVTVEPDGDFTFHPAASTSCTDTSDFFDYTVTDGGTPAAGTDQGRVTIAIAGCVWYVDNEASGNSGTSSAPFDTLAQAETASGSDHTTFVFAGDGTSSGYDTGYAMNSGERLIGEHEGLSVDPDGAGALGTENLHPANSGARPKLTATGEDVVALDDGNEVCGLSIDPSGTGSGIAGASGDTGGGRIDDVDIVDTGVPGSEPGLELISTAGTFDISNLTVDNSGATSPPGTAKGIVLNAAGTVNFASAGTISINTKGAAGLDASTTNMGTGSVFDAISVAGSGNGGVRLLNTTGTTQLGDGSGADLNLTTTSGSAAALAISSGGTVSVPGSGTANISATGGPAVDVGATPGVSLALDDVDSTNSASTGVSLSGLAAGTFSAGSGDIGGAAGTAFSVAGGSGAITYPGTLDNGTGNAASISGRTGGAVTLSGNINDTGDAAGGITVSGNSGGSTTFSGATKTLNTGAGAAVTFNGGDGHALSLSGGGLDIDTTTGKGIDAAGAGTLVPRNSLAVTGSGNTINTGTGTALTISSTDIHSGDVTFQAISSDGAVSGIVLNATGSAGGLTVTGTGSANSGGTIANSTNSGIALQNVAGGVDLSRMSINGGGADGIHGDAVDGFALRNTSVTSNGNAVTESGVEFNGLTGTVALDNATVSGNADHNVAVINDNGALNMTVTNGTYSNTSAAFGNDGIMLEGTGTGSMNATINGSTFSNNKGDHVQVTTDNSTTVSQNVTIQGTSMSTSPLGSSAILGGGITISPGGASNVTTLISANDIQNAISNAIRVDTPSGTAGSPVTANIDATISNNSIGTAATARSGSHAGNGMSLIANGHATVDALVVGNAVRQYTNRHGISISQGDGTNATMNATLRGNSLTNPSNALGGAGGINVRAGITSAPGMGGGPDAGIMCLDIGGAGASANSITGSGNNISPTSETVDLYVWQRFNAKIQLPGLGGATSDAAAKTYFQSRNSAGASVYTETTPADTGFQNRNSGCPTP
jgi:hypothetical protein